MLRYNLWYNTFLYSLLRQGTSIRRTNETDMNAQSSRSHAIFSLTLTQKKFTGSGLPPRSSSPHPPGGRSPSRLARPSSSIYGSTAGARVSSPTLGRPGTPSFASAIGRGVRPASSMGMLTAEGGRRQSLVPGAAQTNGDGEHGEWVTVVSKFHFVDLAGSERVRFLFPSRFAFADDSLPPAQTHCCCWRANQGGYFHQQWTSGTRQCDFRLGRPGSGQIAHCFLCSLQRLETHSTSARLFGWERPHTHDSLRQSCRVERQ